MDVALLSELFADTVFEIFKAQEWTNPADHPGSLSRGQFHRASIDYRYSTSLVVELYKKVTGLIEEVFYQQFVNSGVSGPR